VPFWGPHDDRQIFGFKFPKHCQKWLFIGLFEPPRMAARWMAS